MLASPDATVTTLRWNPIARTMSRASPAPTAMRNVPSAPVWATFWPPTSTTVAPTTGTSPNARVTRPVTSRPCAPATAGTKPRARSADANVKVLLMRCLPFLDGCCACPSCCENMTADSTPHNHACLLLGRLVSRDPPLGPNQDDAARGRAPLVLRRRTDQVRVDLYGENLRREDRHRRGLKRREREIDAIDEVRRGAVIGGGGVQDQALATSHLDHVAGPVGPHLDAGDHPENLLEARRPAVVDIGGVEEVTRRVPAPLLEAHQRQIRLVFPLDDHGVEHRDRVPHHDIQLLDGVRPDRGLRAAGRVADGAGLDNPRASGDSGERKTAELIGVGRDVGPDRCDRGAG